MRDLIAEIAVSVRRNKLRTCLTGFAVAWGIFMLIVLLGAGQGLINSFAQSSGSFATNTIMFGGGYTSKAHDGLKAGRRIILDEKDFKLTTGPLFANKVDKATATIGLRLNASLGRHNFTAYLEGNLPTRMELEHFVMLGGRFINDKDVKESRKVVTMPDKIASKMLDPGVNPCELIGKKVKLDNFLFTVVGITKSDMMTPTSFMPHSALSRPFST